MIRVKNTTDSEIIICDTLLRENGEDGSIYEIETDTQSDWAENSQMISLIASGSITVEYFNEDIVDINKAINILKGTQLSEVKVQELPQSYPFNNKYLPDGKKLYRRKHGKKETCPANGSVNIDMIIPYGHCKIDEVEVVGCSSGDTVDLTVLDSEEGSYSGQPNLMLNQFGFDVNLSEGYYSDSSNYEADLYVGMVMRVTFKNSSSEPVEVGANYVLHEVK